MDANTFKDGVMEVFSYAQHGTCDDVKIEALIQAIEEVRGECARPSKHLIAAFTTLYPNIRLDVETLGKKLDDELELVGRIGAGGKLTNPEIGRLSDFCREMWYQHRLLENGRTPHG